MVIDNLSEPNGRQTEFLLKSISTRLSGREDCKKIAYRVTIDHNGVSMFPLILVWPNRYMRKEADKLDIVSWVHLYKMRNARLSEFVFGTYEYQLSAEGKQRRWRKVE
jgi:hypothetical protein